MVEERYLHLKLRFFDNNLHFNLKGDNKTKEFKERMRFIESILTKNMKIQQVGCCLQDLGHGMAVGHVALKI